MLSLKEIRKRKNCTLVHPLDGIDRWILLTFKPLEGAKNIAVDKESGRTQWILERKLTKEEKEKIFSYEA